MRSGVNGRFYWVLVAALIAAPAAIPVGVVLTSFLTPEREVWQHLNRYVLADVIPNTILLVIGVSAISAVIGTVLAWLTASCEFPGRRFFSWALVLPLALPGYVLALIAIGLLDYAGPAQTALREWFGGSAWFPPIRSRGGVIAVLSLALYPYVYLLARNAFMTQGTRLLEVARTSGLGPVAAFFRVALPMARPWIAGGTLLVALETLADFGTVAVFNYDTFTTAIYEAWFSLFSIRAALQLASILLLLAMVALAIEQFTRRGRRFTTRDSAAGERLRLQGWAAFSATFFALLVFVLAFAVPVLQLAVWAWHTAQVELDARYVRYVSRTLTLAGIGAFLATLAALLGAYAVRQRPSTSFLKRIATSGYALPGPLLVVGLFVPVVVFGNWLTGGLESFLNKPVSASLAGGTLATMFAAYVARFYAVAAAPVDGQFLRIRPSLDEASASLGVAGIAMLRRIHFPILRGGLLTGFALVFVEIIKEMPITLMTRPFGWDTLAVRVFELTSEGEWQRAALPALAIVIAGLVPVRFLIRQTEHVAGNR